MKKILLFFIFSTGILVVYAQNSQWTWMGGDSITDRPAVYGIKGVATAVNKPPARSSPVMWTDKSGNLWLFGGASGNFPYSGYFNDLWKFDPVTNMWTWVSGDSTTTQNGVYGKKGIAGKDNKPGGRTKSVAWRDAAGSFWIFSGEGYAGSSRSTGILNEIWKYDPAAGQWTWVGGDTLYNRKGVYGTKGIADAGNIPGARQSSLAFTDASGTLWLFGGLGFANSFVGALNDLWKYDPLMNRWAWISGDSVTNAFGVYGTKGIAASGNKPGGRYESSGCTDATGNLWLFGGMGNAAASPGGTLNDAWKYNPVLDQWTWMSGDQLPNQPGIYGSKGTGSTTVKPGARSSAGSWADASGTFWLYGGYATEGLLTDLWKYEPVANIWTWVSGDSTLGSTTSTYVGNGYYGIKGIAAAANKPSARRGAVSCTDAQGNFWFFGGSGGYITIGINPPTSTINNQFNDLWKYNDRTNEWTWLSGDCISLQSSVFSKKGIFNGANTPGGRAGALTLKDASGNVWLYGGRGRSSLLGDLWKFDQSIHQWGWMGGDILNTQERGSYGVKGIAAAANYPPDRISPIGWADTSNGIWLFGGYYDNIYGNELARNDLWRYDIRTNLWTWMNGEKDPYSIPSYGTKGVAAATNNPGPRSRATSWTDATGNFWLFGGEYSPFVYIGYPPQPSHVHYPLNDVWKYDPKTNLWTWMSGDQRFFNNQLSTSLGVYGTRNIPDTANRPGARSGSVSWTDPSGNAWLFGGVGYGTGTSIGYLNDVWKFDQAAATWVWVSGDSVINRKGVYGIKGTAASANIPAARTGAVSWMDTVGNYWLFGGYGQAAGPDSVFNDLWMFNAKSLQWTWVSGDSTTGKNGVYGIKEVGNNLNYPGARTGASGWTDASGNLWLFGGSGKGAGSIGGNYPYLFDLWKFTPASPVLPVKYIYFTAVPQNNTVVLNWQAGNDQYSAYYAIERSRDDVGYDSIGTLTATANVQAVNSYAFIDPYPFSKVSYYRIRQVDKYGKYTYSITRKVVTDSVMFSYTLGQNPVTSELRIFTKSDQPVQLQLEVGDAAGHVLIRQSKAAGRGTIMHVMPVRQFAAGMYFITVTAGKASITKTFIKQ